MQRRDGLQAPDLGAGRGRDTPPVGSRCGAGERRSTCGNPAQGGLAALRVPTGEWCLALWKRRGGWESARQRVKEENGQVGDLSSQNPSRIIYPDAILGFEVVLVLRIRYGGGTFQVSSANDSHF